MNEIDQNREKKFEDNSRVFDPVSSQRQFVNEPLLRDEATRIAALCITGRGASFFERLNSPYGTKFAFRVRRLHALDQDGKNFFLDELEAMLKLAVAHGQRYQYGFALGLMSPSARPHTRNYVHRNRVYVLVTRLPKP